MNSNNNNRLPALQAQQLQKQQVALLFRQAPFALLGTVTAALLFAYLVRAHVPGVNFVVWLGGFLALSLLRYGHVLSYRYLREQFEPGWWAKWFVLGAGLSGTAWGLANIYLFPADSLMHQVLLAFLVGGLGAATLATYVAVLPATLAFIVPSLLPTTVRFLLQPDDTHLAMGTMLSLYTVVLLFTAKRMHVAITEALKTGLENSSLVAHLSSAKQEAEALNRELRIKIAEKAAAEQQARGSEERYRVLSTASFEGLAIHRNGTIFDLNTNLATMLGYEPHELIGKTAFEFTAPESHRLVRERLGTRNQEPTEVVARCRDGTTFPIEMQGKNFPFKGETVRVVAIRDITERKESEERIRRSEAELRSILGNIQDAIYRTNRDGKIVWTSPSSKRLSGYDPEEVVGTRLDKYYVAEHGREDFIAALDRSDGTISDYEVAMRRKDGSIIWISVNAHYYRDPQGNVLGVEGSVRDITELKYARDALSHEQERALVTLASIGDGVITTNTANRIDYINPAAEQLTGWTNAQARGKPIADVLNVTGEISRQHLLEPGFGVNRIGTDPHRPLILQRPNGEESAIMQTASPIRNRKGRRIGYVVVFRDVTELCHMERELSHQATHDSLTGLINRYEFERRLASLLEGAAEQDTRHALCYLDLDQFKIVNDTCGHSAGDELLKQLSAQLRTKIRGTDTLGRLGGDEFGILLERCPITKAKRIAHNLRQVVRDFRFRWNDKVFEVGASIGVVPISPDSGTLTDIFSAADSACYVAKDQGGNQIHIYQPDDIALARRRGEMRWVHRIKHALQDDRFLLHMQAAIPVETGEGRLTYHEILLRMKGEDGELIAPMAFIPAAERYHLMPDIDHWVIDSALKAFGQERCECSHSNSIIAINLSGQSLSRNDCLESTVSLLQRHDFPLNGLCFEITETAVIANLAQALNFITTLKEMGCLFALDDFGSGLSSFGYLKNLPVDFLKIDGSFVKNMVDDPIDRAMVETINQIGHLMGKRTIAEFVSSEAILSELREIGVDYVQGFHIEKPQPL